MNRSLRLRASLLAVTALAAVSGACTKPPRATGEMPHQAYVWQRAWRAEVVDAVQAVGETQDGLGGVVALAAEVDLTGDRPEVTTVDLDYVALEALVAAGADVGLALRIGNTPARFAQQPQWVRSLSELAGGLVTSARSRGVVPTELQIDHDCPTSRLTDCALVLAAVREAVAPLPTVFTALPTWLDNPRGFERMTDAADGFVLQVHGLSMPKDRGGEPTLVDPRAAQRAVEAAARFRRPYRVALPTFTHLVAVDSRGELVRVLSENAPSAADLSTAAANYPVRWHAVGSSPEVIAELVRGWTASRPEGLEGVLWYRLPVAGDRLNWSPDTLAAVIAGRPPERDLGLRFRNPEPGLVEVDLINRGGTREPPPERIALSWGEGRLLAADGLAGYRFDPAAGELTRHPGAAPFPQAAGEHRTIAWLRFQSPEEVRGDIVR